MSDATALVRAAAERSKPNGERLPEYTDQALVAVQQQLEAPTPIYKDLEELNLSFLFTTLRRDLGADDPFVRKVLGNESPEQLAHRARDRHAAYGPEGAREPVRGRRAAIASSTDPMIRFAAGIDPDLRAIRKEYEDRVTAPTRAAAERIAKARFAVYGTSVDPDATFTLRLSYGTVKGWTDAEGKSLRPSRRSAGSSIAQPARRRMRCRKAGLRPRATLTLDTPMNFVTTNDIIGGNSGSPAHRQERRSGRAHLRRQHPLAGRRLRLRSGAQPFGRGRQPRAA